MERWSGRWRRCTKALTISSPGRLSPIISFRWYEKGWNGNDSSAASRLSSEEGEERYRLVVDESARMKHAVDLAKKDRREQCDGVATR